MPLPLRLETALQIQGAWDTGRVYQDGTRTRTGHVYQDGTCTRTGHAYQDGTCTRTHCIVEAEQPVFVVI